MSTPDDRRQAIADVAADWRDPEHSTRVSAVEQTLEAPNRWTEEALEYALNRWMQRFTVEALRRWVGTPEPTQRLSIGVFHGSSGPVAGFRDAIALWLSGHAYLGHLPDASPALLPAFAEQVADQVPDLASEFVTQATLFDRADALMAQAGAGNADDIRRECSAHDIPERRRLIRPARYAVGVLDGNEGEDVRDRFAEDLLLYEGQGRRRLALLWAPRDLSPDPYLEAMARFRGAFPVHVDTPGALQMQKAFLEAKDASHAYAEGLEFLVSRGAPEPQPHGHIRWAEYEDLADVRTWIHEQGDDVYALVARESLHDRLPDAVRQRTPGGLHTPPLDDPEGKAIVQFLRSVGVPD